LESIPNNSFSGNGKIKIDEYSPNKITLDINTDSNQFLVLSEVFYPAGWTAKINDVELKILQTNHILRGISVPEGNYKLVLEFEPDTYYSSLTFVWIGNLLILGLIFVPCLLGFSKKKLN
jgi:uncharacterized membrane protein YfhO